jgi:hypothetical protein
MDAKDRANRRYLVRGCVTLLLLPASGYFVDFVYHTRPRQIIGSLFRLESVPGSIRDAECESGSSTDVLTTCYFKIHPAEFPALLKGWSFRQTPAVGSSHSFAGGFKVGPDFLVADEFVVQDPPEFLNGGFVSSVTDEGRAQAQVYYYQE